MLLISPTDAALAIGAKCGGSAPSADEPALLSILNYITARVEAAMGVRSLTFESCLDRVRLQGMPTAFSTILPQRCYILLTNGFVVPDCLVLTDPNGTVVDNATLDVDNEMGVITLLDWIAGAYQIEYQSGFEPSPEPAPLPAGYDPDLRVLQDTPTWMRAIPIAMLIQWYRVTLLQPRVNKDLARSYADMQSAINRDIHRCIYTRYQRPRYDCNFAERRG